MADLVTLGVEIQARGGAQAARDIDRVKASSTTAARAVDSLEDQTKALGVANTNAAKSTRVMADGITRIGRSAGAQRGALQNVSFQLQDVVTQVQLGTDPIRALSIQLPQLLGGFGALGAAAGLAVGLLGGLISSLFDTESAADAASDATERFEDALAGLEDFSGSKLEDLTSKYGVLTQSIEQAVIAQSQFNAVIAAQGLQTLIAGIASDNSALGPLGLAVRAAESGQPDALSQIVPGLTPQGAGEISTAFQRLDNAQSRDEQFAAIEQLSDTLIAVGATSEGASEELRKYAMSVVDARLSIAEYNQSLGEAETAAERLKAGLDPVAPAARDGARALGDFEKHQRQVALTFQQMDKAAEQFYRDQEKRDRERARIEAQRQRELDRQAREFGRDFVDPITSGMEAVLTGARSFGDAMERVALDLASALIRRNVSQPLTEGLSGILSSVDLSDLFSFAGGGYTGSGPRAGGLDGQGGYLAMVHPNETVVDHTRGGGMGSAVVVNIRNENGGQVQTSQRGNELDIIIKAVGRDISGGGTTFQAIKKTFGVQPQMMRRA